MADGFTHKFVNGLAGSGVVIAEQEKEQPINPLLAIGTETAFAKSPDILEPAVHSHHRQFFHNFIVLGAIAYGLKKVYEWKPEDRAGDFWGAIALCAGVGYIGHLAPDVPTPKSLLVVCKL